MKKAGLFGAQDKNAPWQSMNGPIGGRRQKALSFLKPGVAAMDNSPAALRIVGDLERPQTPFHRAIHASLDRMQFMAQDIDPKILAPIKEMLSEMKEYGRRAYRTHLLVESNKSPLKVEPILPRYLESSLKVDGRQIIQKFFELKLSEDPRVFICGEDVGQLGGVNLEFEGLASKFGDLRVTDTGIREATIFGQGLGSAMRGLRPIVDIQYLDYLLYCLQGMSDDLATLHYRTAGGQVAPVIVRTKGHRLEGIWHTGSPIGMILNAIRGVHFCVPRNMVQAAGFYNTLLKGDDPGLVIEVLSGYRIKETVPENLGSYCLPLGEVEILAKGSDITVATYGANCRIAMEAKDILLEMESSIDLLDS